MMMKVNSPYVNQNADQINYADPSHEKRIKGYEPEKS